MTTGAQMQVSSSRSWILEPKDGRPRLPNDNTPWKQKLMVMIISIIAGVHKLK